MSQAGQSGTSALSPTVATSYVTDSGTAVPALNIINVLGAGTTSTSGSGNTITITSSGGGGGGLTWSTVTGATQTIAASNGYINNRGGGITYTLPASGTAGDEFRIVGYTGAWTIAQNANQQILVGTASSTVGVGGSVASTNAADCITCICVVAGASAVWRAFPWTSASLLVT